MPTSPVKTRIPLTSFGHLISEVKRQLFGIEPPATVNLSGWRKHFNSYTLQGRRNFVLVTYAAMAVGGAAAYIISRRRNQEVEKSSSTTSP